MAARSEAKNPSCHARATRFFALPAPRAGKVSWKEFVAVYEKQRAKLAEDYEAAAASLSSRFKAAKAPAEGMSKDDAIALVRAVGEAGDMVAGTDNGE